MNITLLAPLLFASVIDSVDLGSPESESEHGFLPGASYACIGAYGERCRRIRRPEPESWYTGEFTFTLKVRREGDNYITFKWSGDDVTHDHLAMTIDGKMLGQMHLGEYDLLDYEQCYPRDGKHETSDSQYPGRFTYTTFLLPENAVKGKDEVTIGVRSLGHVWGYGEYFEQFQKTIRNDSRGIYAVYLHSTAYFHPGREALAKISPPKPVAMPDTSFDLDAVKKKVEAGIAHCLWGDNLIRKPDRIRFLAKAYRTPGWSAYRNPEALKKIVAAVDDCATRHRRNPDEICPNGSWWGACNWARGVMVLGEKELSPLLDEELTIDGASVRRREAWADVFRVSVERLMTHRRFFANQCQIVDCSAHACNRAWHICDPAASVPLETTLDHVREAVGLKACPNGYWTLSPKGLAEELGYVGSYGESTIWATLDAYECSLDYETGKGDAELLKQMRKACEARLYFRFPTCRRDGTPVMRLESYVSWRNEHFPSDPCYAARGISLRPMLAARSPLLLGAVADEIADGEFARRLKGLGRECFDEEMLSFPENWSKTEKLLAKAGDRLPHLPMRGGDFTWADEENAIVAVKYGSECFWAEMFYRSHRDVANRLARIHYVTPEFETVGTVRCDTEFVSKLDKDGNPEFDTEPDYFQYGWMGKCYAPYRGMAGGLPSNALAGTIRPKTDRGGRCEFYRLGYGPFLVGLNDSRHGKTFELDVPKGEWKLLPNGNTVKGPCKLAVKPGTTLVLRKMCYNLIP